MVDIGLVSYGPQKSPARLHFGLLHVEDPLLVQRIQDIGRTVLVVRRFLASDLFAQLVLLGFRILALLSIDAIRFDRLQPSVYKSSVHISLQGFASLKHEDNACTAKTCSSDRIRGHALKAPEYCLDGHGKCYLAHVAAEKLIYGIYRSCTVSLQNLELTHFPS